MDNVKNMKSFMAECETCKHKFEIYSGDNPGEDNAVKSCLNYRKEFKINGKSIFLTYYDCPKCGRRHFVQIDDAVSIEKFEDVKRMFVKLAIMKHRGEEIPEKQSAKFKKARQHLSDYRIKLMKEYTGKLIRNNETESDFVLRFSV